MAENRAPYTWKRLLVAMACAVGIIAAGDAVVRAFVPTPALGLREAWDGIADLESKTPDILILGSSHARTFHVLGQEIERRTGGAVQVVSIPLEMGKAVPYLWLLEHRIEPLLDAPTRSAERRRARLKRFILLTEWWDTCPPEGGTYGNLPSRAWSLTDYAADVVDNGFTGWNRNYVQRRWQRFWGASVFSRVRGSEDFATAVRVALGGRADDREAATLRWQHLVEDGARCLGNPEQMEAMSKILDFARERGLETTVVLFPRKPGTYTERARHTTSALMSRLMTQFCAERGVRLVDMTLSTPLTDDDFMADFDHVNAAGNRKFAAWALDGELKDLLSTGAGANGAASAGASR